MRTVAECSADIDEKNSRFELINETRLNENPPEGGFSFVILTNLTLKETRNNSDFERAPT